ncbi:MAG: cytochrome c oxidase assembly protein [Methylophilaceae bacterium]|nr:cytochrome c oxidase assembly protein [Methylophilaceae bacterium]MBL6728935.1 cytochrome c oxidase assembly protein [Methylophilaceae bacterium]MBL6790687.1 cytochrome c oxidase assembly protein [Methylophilaceae bacterium]
MSEKTKIKKTTLMLFFVTLLMFGFGYAMVPLYDVFCEITGLNGRTVNVVTENEKENIASDRIVRVQFDSNINGDLPWRMKAKQTTMHVQLGKFYEAVYTVENMYNGDVIGQAIPSVMPGEGSLYFKKSECFCFVNQLLEAGETKEMVVRFEVDKDLPENVDLLTLSYTFFRAKPDKS